MIWLIAPKILTFKGPFPLWDALPVIFTSLSNDSFPKPDFFYGCPAYQTLFCNLSGRPAWSPKDSLTVWKAFMIRPMSGSFPQNTSFYAWSVFLALKGWLHLKCHSLWKALINNPIYLISMSASSLRLISHLHFFIWRLLFPVSKWPQKKKNNLWSDIKTSLLNVKHAQSAGLTGGFSKFHREGKKPGLTWSTYVSVITLRLHSPSRHAGRPVPGLFSVSVTLSKFQHPTQITNEWHNIHPFRPLVKQKTKAYFKKVPFPAEKKKKNPTNI